MWQWINLVLAVLWMLGAVGALAYQHVRGDQAGGLFANGLVPWVFLAFAVYNYFRWWGAYMVRRAQRQVEAENAVRAQEKRLRDLPPPDPTFHFGDSPAVPGPSAEQPHTE